MRTVKCINKGWKFVKSELPLSEAVLAKGKRVDLPHTWNNLDGEDGGNDYVRGAFWYVKEIETPKLNGKELYVEFEGVSQIAEVYFNGELITRHEGGFSTFRCNLTKYLKESGKNILAVMADNRPNEITYPQFADFTFFGGIYRKVNLITVSKTHFDLDYYGGSGVMITPKVTKDGKAEVEVKTYITNKLNGQTLKLEILDNTLNEISFSSQSVEDTNFNVIINKPHLWNGVTDPYLYIARLSILDDKKVLDNVEIKFGIRTFEIDAAKGFILNGVEYPLRGVCRHQDRLHMGWAITEKEHTEDMALIKEVGANTIRLAHYQHDSFFYDLCDQNGMVVWAEIPFISRFMPTAEKNTLSQMQELIIQNYNHPSIVVWGLSNEITISSSDNDEALIENHKKLNDLCHSLDKTRLTTMAQVSMLDEKSEMNKISDVISYNHYFGWYGGDVADNPVWLDNFHKNNPEIKLGISEYGCEAVLKWHTSKPEMGDYTEEYQAYYHEKMLETIMTRKYLWATHLWNMFDFAVDMRDEGGMKGRNDKGLVTIDRKTKKDSFFVYKAYWSKEPFVHLSGKRYVDRAEENTSIKVYSNQSKVSLIVNGKAFEEKSGEKVFQFTVPLKKGRNIIVASTGSLRDEMVIKRVNKENKKYILAESQGQGVTNWFDKEGNKVEFLYPDGYFSIKDKIGDIIETNEGKAIFDDILKGVKDMMGGKEDFKVNDGMIKMMRSFTLVRIAKMAGDKFPKEKLYEINCKLNQIKKQ